MPAPKADLIDFQKWNRMNLILFRIVFIFFVIMSIPNNYGWYRTVLAIDWTNLHFLDLYKIARFDSGISFSNHFKNQTLGGFDSWLSTFFISLIGALLWTAISFYRKYPAQQYNLLYYWLRVIVRYRAGIGIIAFGFTKLFPEQMPYPSLGILNTNFGDFTMQKIYWLSIGIVPWYEVFAGVVEVCAGILLLFRKTTTWGALLLFGALGDILAINIAYNGGVHVYSAYFVLFSAFLLVKDVFPIYNLLILERWTRPNIYYPEFSKPWQKQTRFLLKFIVLFLFVFVLFKLQWLSFRYDPYKQPSTTGVKMLRGNYMVTEFKVNNIPIPYSPNDSLRWRQVTFEDWTTLTFKVNKVLPIDLTNGSNHLMQDIYKVFELTGMAGGHRVFHYYADTLNHVLYLQDKYEAVPSRNKQLYVPVETSGFDNKNKISKYSETFGDSNWIDKQTWIKIGDENTKISHLATSTLRDKEFNFPPRKEIRDRMILKYSTNDGSKIILSGINSDKDSLYIVLNKTNRIYTLQKSTISAGNY